MGCCICLYIPWVINLEFDLGVGNGDKFLFSYNSDIMLNKIPKTINKAPVLLIKELTLKVMSSILK